LKRNTRQDAPLHAMTSERPMARTAALAPGDWLASWRYLWALPCTLVGIAALLPWLACGARLCWRRGAIEASLLPHRRSAVALARRLPFAAITLGHVVLACSPRAMRRWRAHERVHVRQCERWGPLFFPAYLAAGAWQWLRGRSAWRDNPFEVQAILRAGDCAPAAGSSPASA
jgi:hypothetical protein